MRTINHIVVHCTATQQNTSIEAIQNYWANTLGWKNAGYHYIIKANGDVVQLLSDDKIANGVRGFNHNSVHLSYIGGVDRNNQPLDNRTPEQKRAMRELIERLLEKYPDAEIKGHRDFQGVTKACPSFDVCKWVDEWRTL
jgi:N-acetylmuramoyl-L-alanine amidase